MDTDSALLVPPSSSRTQNVQAQDQEDENPTITRAPAEDGDDQASEDEEDGGLDWTKLLPAALRPVIPKRGEKEYEPRAGGGSNLQLHVLDRSRNAMFETLKAQRTVSSKVVSYALWHSNFARAEVTLMRGIHFASMGHSAPRPVAAEEGTIKIQKRLELLPEETIYLIERGSLFCWKSIDTLAGLQDERGLENVPGAPMTVQQAYAEMIGVEDLTLEKYQVFTYLKRLGYVVTRTQPPSDYYPTPSSTVATAISNHPSSSILSRFRALFALCGRLMQRILSPICASRDWWRPIQFSTFGKSDKSHAWIYKTLRFMPSGHSVPLVKAEPKRVVEKMPSKQSPYTLFYNIYKPSTPFKKSAPGPPDFQMVVVNARTTPMPTLHELTALFDISPELPPPVPRVRYNPTQGKPPSTSAAQATTLSTTEAAQPATASPSLLSRLFPWFFPASPPPPPWTNIPGGPTVRPPRPPNPFVHLKAGKKMVLIAAVDSGNISFFRFSQGEFGEWTMA
ncbi:tRNA-splicing endonuclease subunit sen54 N-term-domain-containing protein [Coprinopsis sp. MPI-PUGE-AT-0042]|nr:tRNA-splicing endonuclease subunit sen54 N-term-domain-containing protein [Coprinopsis sp. MPI-PUGE-AT-0042]